MRLPFIVRPICSASHASRASIRQCRYVGTTASKLTDVSITPGSENHNDLPSFLTYAERVNLLPSKTVYVGTHYEYTVADALKRLGFTLTRTGRQSDHGIDLIGTWTLNLFPFPLRVFAQCKANNQKLSPASVRELEGAFNAAPASWRGEDVLGLLAGTQNATRGVRDALVRSRWPMGFLKISREGLVEQFLWNKSATERGLEGVDVGTRHALADGADEDNIKEVVLCWKGQEISPGAVDLALPRMEMPGAAQSEMNGVEVLKPRRRRASSRNTAAYLGNDKAEAIEPKSRRGCPRKTATDPMIDKIEILKPKTREGRPRKTVTDVAIDGVQVLRPDRRTSPSQKTAADPKIDEAEGLLTERKRGRPRKPAEQSTG